MHPDPASPAMFRTAGTLYVAIIVLGLTSEIAIRAPLASLDAQALASAILRAETAFRLSIAADTIMVVADIVLAALLFLILAPAGAALAALAALFRLVQATVIAGNLSNQQAALSWAQIGEPEFAAQALMLHGSGYDTGLIFFGVNGLLTGVLLARHAAFPRWLGTLVGASGLVYLTGSYLRMLAPAIAETFQPAYLIAVVAETAFAATLLWHGWTGWLKSQAAT